MTLDQCGDVLTITELLAVLKIQKSKYYQMRQHGAFPIDPLPHLGGAIRYSKLAVTAYLASATPDRTVRRPHGGFGAPSRFQQVAGAAGRGR